MSDKCRKVFILCLIYVMILFLTVFTLPVIFYRVTL